VLSHIQDFLLGLGSFRAWFFFLAAFVFSTLLIFADYGKPISPAVPVLLYGALLFYCQARLYVPLNSTTKDSPYFLGFLLTLVALLKIVYGMTGVIEGQFLIREVGTAVLTTVAGLFMRQLLLSRDPGEEAQDQLFRSIADEVRKDTVEFHDAQKLFVKLVREFVQAREDLFAREETASAEYVQNLQDGAALLGEIQKTYPKRIEGLLTAIETSGERLNDRCGQIEQSLARIAQSYAMGLEKDRDSLASAREAFQSELTTLRSAITESSSQLTIHYKELSELAQAYPQVGSTLVGAVAALSEAIKDVKGPIETLRGDIVRVGGDMRSIDKIVDDLVRILSEQMSALSAHV
jgi:methyl-accepting chemotaxis protein